MMDPWYKLDPPPPTYSFTFFVLKSAIWMMSCSADDEDPGAFLSHWWQAVHILNEHMFVLPLSWAAQGLRLAQITPQIIQSHT